MVEKYPNAEDEQEGFDWQKLVAKVVVDREYETDKANDGKEKRALDDAINMLNCDRD